MFDFHSSSFHKSITFRFLDLMLAVLAIKLDLMHAERHVKVSEDFL